ncbi:MAG: polyribonucleotide nucleotidyltransferase [Candidatus Moranbacteria bacterium RIFOXYB1_FULL_43_19]|nr:MAG: polyribonucleotide nucleotidyltransferase [Candidatus Moranbacteria bacterium RIFOXYB1_FULL_43_19]OGI34066.1 MAG: polyribonucleotide nucleotidyltransferase [Candidatus Moranbacteria bacterium RIFOXYC1_FULL_44_13]
MEKVKKFETEVAGRKLIIESGLLANQANASVTVRYGDTMVLATAVMSPGAREGMNYFPLMVDYEEKFYASGKIKGSRFIKREGRPTDEAVLNGRLIDRTLRPLFNQQMRNEVQVIVTVLSIDQENDPALVGAIAASTALTISDIPWNGPIGAVRVGEKDGKPIINPVNGDLEKSSFNIFACGIEEKINMIETDAKDVAEAKIFEALSEGQKTIDQIVHFINDIRKEIGKPKADVSLFLPDENFAREIIEKFSSKIRPALFQKDHSIQTKLQNELFSEAGAYVDEKYPDDPGQKKELALVAIDAEMQKLFDAAILEKDERPDGRKLDEVRPISCQVGILPRTHGSALFTRGETQALTVVTLGAPGMEQIIDTMELDEKKRFMHHYNFPPFSVGEVKPMRGPGRREIGHGALAEKALLPVVPDKESFPYTIRLVSEILSSNGSSSMASTCGSNLALLDAGVPTKSAIGGISVGIVIGPDGKYKLLSDIQGPEDHFGGMDFKIAGSVKGITAIQLDVKTDGLSPDMIRDTLELSRKNRIGIIDIMSKTLAAPRADLSKYAPRIITLKINPEKIRDVIGPGGKVINQIIDETGVEIDIEDDGLVFITADNPEAGKKALEWVKNLTHEVVPGEVFKGRITRLMNFGAFAEILPGQEGLVHISEISEKRIGKVEDVLKVGQMVTVKVKEIDNLGRINLTMRGLENSVK